MSQAKMHSHPEGRRIIHKTRGQGGAITRLMSPSDLGAMVKPFVFLDLIDFPQGAPAPPIDAGWHPHSGIATVTVTFEGTLRYAETTGNSGNLSAGGVEWMQAGGGVWHTATGDASSRIRGFQLWVALPPERELTPSESRYLAPSEVPQSGPVRLVLGAYAGLKSPIASPPMNYLAVTLKHGERWTYQPPSGHDVAWVSVLEGELRTPAGIRAGELAIFEDSERAISSVAHGETRFVLGSAPRHPHELTLGHYSVHTSPEALAQGEAEIRRQGRQLSAAGKRSYALNRFG